MLESRQAHHGEHDSGPGCFAGVALATVDVAYFAQVFKKFDIGQNGAVTLLNTDGIVLARSRDNGSYVGRDLSSTPLFSDRSRYPATAAFYFKSPLDGIQRLSFYKVSDHFPVMIVATKARDEVLASWHKDADFRLLAEESSDMVTSIGMDERLHYVSPSSARVVGWLPEQLMKTPALAGVHPEDLPRVEAMVAALKRGEMQDARIVYRSRHRQKKEIWIESTLRVTKNFDTEEIDGVVAISRDMTEYKNLEQKLAALAALDGLTGLANRRHFDERLENEWARARREGTTLSLLMIDVDHFKKFNDRYGHPAGDACLRSVANVLAAQVRRPADLAARYGGEEFVLLLPDADAAGCQQIGKRIRESLATLGIVHDLNLPSRQLTVSIGGAAADCRGNQAPCQSLIAAADRALHSAKENGRDRLVMSGQIMDWARGKTA